MSVELIENQTFVDLTGGQDETKETDTTQAEGIQGNETSGVLTQESGAPESGATAETTADAQEEQASADDGTSNEPNGDSVSPADAEQSDVEYFFGGEKVQVTVPEEISAALTEAGVDQNDLLTQLFKKDGDFSLDEDTRTKLETKFGKLMVDGYLNMYKTMNNQVVQQAAADREAAAASEAKMHSEYAEAVGGVEGLTAMEDYIIKNMSENEIAAYNAVMESDNHSAHLLVIGQIKSRMALEQQLKEQEKGDKRVSLVGDNTPTGTEVGSPLDKGYLDADEYSVISQSDKYWTDREYQSRVDAARMAGIRKEQQ